MTNYANALNGENSLIVLRIASGVLAMLGILCFLSVYHSQRKMRKMSYQNLKSIGF